MKSARGRHLLIVLRQLLAMLFHSFLRIEDVLRVEQAHPPSAFRARVHHPQAPGDLHARGFFYFP